MSDVQAYLSPANCGRWSNDQRRAAETVKRSQKKGAVCKVQNPPPKGSSMLGSSHPQHRSKPVEKLFRKFDHGEDFERQWFVDALIRAFPMPKYTTENERADHIAEQLTAMGRPVNARTVRNWLRGENTPAFRYLVPVLGLVGVEGVLSLVYGEHAA